MWPGIGKIVRFIKCNGVKFIKWLFECFYKDLHFGMHFGNGSSLRSLSFGHLKALLSTLGAVFSLDVLQEAVP